MSVHRALIFANGPFKEVKLAVSFFRQGDLIIAADGGARHALTAGLTPALVVGDMDSIDTTTRQRVESSGAQLMIYPQRKDATDLELALGEARQGGAAELFIFGAMGGRPDHSLANLQLAASPAWRHQSVRVFGDGAEIRVLHGGETLDIEGPSGMTVGLIPARKAAEGVVTEGLEYPLSGETLEATRSRGVSNHLLEKRARVKLTSGTLWVVLIR